MGEFIGPAIFLLFVVFSIIGNVQKQRREAEQRKQQVQKHVRAEDLPEATRRALYGDVPMGEGRGAGGYDIPTAQPRAGAPSPPPLAQPQSRGPAAVDPREELRRRQEARAAELARQRAMAEEQRAAAQAARERELTARRSVAQQQPGNKAEAEAQRRAKQEEMKRQAAEVMRRTVMELMGADPEQMAPAPQPPQQPPQRHTPKQQKQSRPQEPQEGPRRRPQHAPPPPRATGAPLVARPDSPRAWLRNKHALRQAIVLREVLGTPRGLE